jgi:hypothetical protein
MVNITSHRIHPSFSFSEQRISFAFRRIATSWNIASLPTAKLCPKCEDREPKSEQFKEGLEKEACRRICNVRWACLKL